MERFHNSGNTVDSLAFETLAAQKALKLQKRRRSHDAVRRPKTNRNNPELANHVKVAAAYVGVKATTPNRSTKRGRKKRLICRGIES